MMKGCGFAMEMGRRALLKPVFGAQAVPQLERVW